MRFLTAYGHAMDNVDRMLRPRGSVLVAADPDVGRLDPIYSASISSQLLITTAIEHCKVFSKASRIASGTDDPLGECFVCAASTKTVLTNGENWAQLRTISSP